jgi:hypothetical protein
MLKGKVSCARFLKSTTCVVLSEDEAFNNQLIYSFEQSWNITPVKFISIEEFKATISNTELSFVYINEFNVMGNKKEIGALALFNGGFTDTDFYLHSCLAYVPYDNWGIEKELADIDKRLPAMVFQLQETVSLIYEFDISGNNENAITRQLTKIYNERAGVLKDKTLLIDVKYKSLKITSIDQLAKTYKYAFEFVSSEEIKKAVDSKDPTKAILSSSFNLHKCNQVFNCSTYEVVFCELEVYDVFTQSSLDKFDFGDMEELSSCVKKSKAN